MLQLRQLHLQLAFMSARALGKDIENQTGAIQHPALELTLQVPLLTGTEGMIEHDNLGLMQLHFLRDFLQLAGTDKGAGIGHGAAAHDKSHRITARRQNQLLKLARIFPLVFAGYGEVNKNCAFAGRRALKKQAYLECGEQTLRHRSAAGRDQLSPSSSSGGFCMGMRTTREGTTVEMACL